MAGFEVDEIIHATGGTLITGGGKLRPFRRVQTDSREIRNNDLFIALKGEKFDGHQFISVACQAGATGAVVSEANAWEALRSIRGKPREGSPFAIVAVKDTLRAYQDLASYHRDRFSVPVIAVTGSNGKTTTKEMVSQVLSRRWRVLKTTKNFNNAIGVPKTLLGLHGGHQAAVIEMGVDQVGQTARLCEIAHPTIGIITNVGPDHLEFYGTMARSAASKEELLHYLPRTGTAILNQDDKYFDRFSRNARCPLLSFGFSDKADIRAGHYFWDGWKTRFDLSFPNFKKPRKAVIRTMGGHNVSNALAAAATGWTLGLSGLDILAGLNRFRPAPMRSEVRRIGGVIYLYDCYNANPASVKAALDVLAGLDPAKRTIAVLGEMLELGPQEARFHRDIGRYVGQKGVSHLVACGRFGGVMQKAAEQTNRAVQVSLAKNALEAGRILKTLVKKGDIVLVKASRREKMERVLEAAKG